MKSELGTIIMTTLLLLIFAASPAEPQNSALSDEAQKCLECHGSRGIIKKFENNEYVEAYVDAGKFRVSVHKSLKCSDCHTGFSIDSHPKRTFKSKQQYKIRASLSCRRCHSDRQLKSKPVHESLLREEKKGKPFICTGCHGSHYIMPTTPGRIMDDEEKYCMSCHGQDISMQFRSGETMSVKVDISELQGSVHKDHTCSDCHFGFSTEEHPERSFRTKRDYKIASSEVCRRCHFDKYAMTMDSIHHTLLGQGVLKAPVCVDCHGGHSIQSGRAEKILSARRCEKCHSEVFNTYLSSVHGKALIDKHNQDVPVCVDCHTAHSMIDPKTFDFRENVPNICANCHANKEIMGRYGISTDVVRTYLSDFHGVTLRFYKKQREITGKEGRPVAVCTDCHGIHDIVSPRSEDIKANLVKTCLKCHPGATEDFPNAWLYHYEPDFKKYPVIYTINLFYKIFVPLMIIGLMLQIFLHIWRYAVNR